MTDHHLLHLVAQTHARHLLEVLEPRQDLVLHLELRLHAELRALLDGEGLVLERLDGAGRLEVDDDVRAAFDLEAEREDDALARVVGVREVFALPEAERLFPLAEGLVVLVWQLLAVPAITCPYMCP
jgi:hypothetical protein